LFLVVKLKKETQLTDTNVLFQVKENNAMKAMQHELAELRVKVESLKGVETEVKRVNVLLHDKERELETVLISLQHERDEKVDLVNEKECVEKERGEEVERMNRENTKLKAELDELNERIKSNEIGAEGESWSCGPEWWDCSYVVRSHSWHLVFRIVWGALSVQYHIGGGICL